MLTVTLTWVFLLLPGSALADDPPAGADSSEGTGIQVASWALTVPYAICKGAFALGGTAVGSLGYVFSGGNFHTAQTVWTRSIYGTYILRPAHLRGEEPIYFFLARPMAVRASLRLIQLSLLQGISEPAKSETLKKLGPVSSIPMAVQAASRSTDQV